MSAAATRLHLGAWALALCAACAGAPSPAPAPAGGGRVVPSTTAARYGEEKPEPLTALEQQVVAAVRGAPARAGAQPSPSLTRAARELARRAAEESPAPFDAAALRAAMPGALARAGAYDPSPMAALVQARPEEVAHHLAAQAGATPATVLGVAVELRGKRAYAAMLLARRGARLRGFPREVAPGETVVLEGELVGLEQPTVHVTSPEGQSRPVPVKVVPPRGFSAAVPFDAPGRWVLEVVGRGRGGPEVAALLTVACGGGTALDAGVAVAAGPEMGDEAQAEAAVVAAINATRARQGLAPVTADPALREVARRHSAAMAAAGTLAHVLPRSGPVTERLKHAGIPYGVVRENVAYGGTALEAHHVTEASPAHRENLLAPGARRVGCGVARGTGPDGQALIYLTEILVEPPPTARPPPASWQH